MEIDTTSTVEQVVDWRAQPLTSLMSHIVDKHHVFCRQEAARLGSLLGEVVDKHGAAHPELCRIKAVFSDLIKELLMHLVKEEQTLFPYIGRMEDAVTHGIPFSRPAFGTVGNPVRMMVLEHDNAGAALEQMRKLSRDYELPGDACNSYRALYAGLKSFESDMHQHVHLENNVLFPRAIGLEDAALSERKGVAP